jgi:mono/diheme cytochrome c family protein
MAAKWMKRTGIALAVLISGFLLLIVAVLGTGRVRFSRQFAVVPPSLSIPTDEAALARGEHLVSAVAHCGYCHGPQLAGDYVINNPRAEGVFVAPNLTPGEGGLGRTYTTEDWVRAIRHGVTADGRSVMIMPSMFFNDMSTEDLAAVIAYLQSLPPVDHVLPRTAPGPLFYALLGAGPLTAEQSARIIDHEAPFPDPVPAGPTAEYGAYLARIGQCTACHGPELAGGQVANSAPVGPNLTSGGALGDWSEADFITLIRTGMEPSGRQIDPFMPWAYFSQMSDMELSALWAYLQSLPPLADQIVAEVNRAD